MTEARTPRTETIRLPYPPSINHYWRRVGSRTLISRAGRAFRESVCGILAEKRIEPMCGPLGITIDAYPPDRRRRDLDNLLKSLLDSLEHAGAYKDDSQLDCITIWRFGVIDRGRVDVTIREMT